MILKGITQNKINTLGSVLHDEYVVYHTLSEDVFFEFNDILNIL